MDPLFPEHCEERCEERSREAGVKQGLNGDNLGWRTSPSGGVQMCIWKERGVHGVDEDLHVSGGHFVWVGFQLGLDINNKCRGDCREQSSLGIFGSVLGAGGQPTEREQLTKMREVFKYSSYFLVYSRSNSSDSLRYTVKKSARELFVLNGSKNSFRAEWRLWRVSLASAAID